MGLVCLACVCMWERKRQLVGGKLCVKKQNERALDAVILSRGISSRVYRFQCTYEVRSSGCGLHLLWQHRCVILSSPPQGNNGQGCWYIYLFSPHASCNVVGNAIGPNRDASLIMDSRWAAIRKKGKKIARLITRLHVLPKHWWRMTQRMHGTMRGC